MTRHLLNVGTVVILDKDKGGKYSIMENEKSRWKKPELIVLLRSKPEEAVLDACKTTGSPSGSNGRDNTCYAGMDPCEAGCWSLVGS